MNTVDLIAGLIEAGDHEAAIQAVNELVETASALEGELKETQARIAEVVTDPIQQHPTDADVIAKRLRECVESGYFAGVIKSVYTLINHATFLEMQVASLKATIARTQTEAHEKDAWEGRYWALLEEAEASRPRTVEGDGSDLPAGTVVTSVNGVAYQFCSGRWWGFYAPTGRPTLPECGAPYTIVYTPAPEENTND